MIRTDSGVTVRIGQRRPRPGKRQPGSRVPFDGKRVRPAISTLPGRIWSVRPPRGPPACAGASSWVLCGTNLVEAMLVRGQASRGLSARVEGESDRPDLPRLVFGTGEVPVEYPADRVAGQVFQDGIGDELVRSGLPALAGHQLP